MARFRKQNLRQIQCIFEEKTGVDLNPAHRVKPRRHVRTVLIFAAALVFALTMLAFTEPLFSALAGDPLRVSGTYMGDGIVSVYVENDSEKTLRFQEEVKLIRWVTAEEVALSPGMVTLENTEFPPHSSGTMIIDLSKACDIASLENSGTNTESYYLLLTNQSFLFGNDWICSFRFAQPEAEPEAATEQLPVPAEQVDSVEEALRFYFENAYNAPMSLNEVNFQYQQTVDALLARFEGTIVSSLSPSIMVIGPSEYLDPEPMLRDIPEGVIFDEAIPADQQAYLTSWEWTYTDAYGRFVATAGEQAMVQTAMLPQHEALKDQADGGVTIPLIFHMVYDADQASDPESYAFVYGQLLTFAELEQYKVLHDDYYAIYDVTDLIYTDVDAYLDYFLTTRTDVYCDAQIRQRVRSIYNFYQDREAVASLFYYRQT